MAKLHSEKRIKAVNTGSSEDGDPTLFESGDVVYSSVDNQFKKKNGALGAGSWDAIAGGGGASEAFKTITLDGSGAGTVSGDANIVADGATDTLTLAAGSNITLTGTAGSDTILIEAAGGGATNLSIGTSNATTLELVSSTGNNVNLPLANGTIAGIMSDADKDKLDGIQAGAEENAITWTITANGSSAYNFAGPGFAGTEDDPTIYVVRGQKYKIASSIGSHPFQISAEPNGGAYGDGITGNGVTNGTLEWTVRMDAPKVLFYRCTTHPAMAGEIIVLDEFRVSSHRRSFSSDGSSPEIVDLHPEILEKDGGRIVLGVGNYGNNAGDSIRLDLSELYNLPLRETMNFEVYSVGATAFTVDVTNPASGPTTGAQALSSDCSPDVSLNEDATGTISVGAGQFLVLYCDGAGWYYEKRSGL